VVDFTGLRINPRNCSILLFLAAALVVRFLYAVLQPDRPSLGWHRDLKAAREATNVSPRENPRSFRHLSAARDLPASVEGSREASAVSVSVLRSANADCPRLDGAQAIDRCGVPRNRESTAGRNNGVGGDRQRLARGNPRREREIRRRPGRPLDSAAGGQ